MSTAKTITGIVPGLMATSLLAYNVGALDFGLNPKKGKKRVNHTKRIIKTGVTTLVAIPLIGATASMINTIP